MCMEPNILLGLICLFLGILLIIFTKLFGKVYIALFKTAWKPLTISPVKKSEINIKDYEKDKNAKWAGILLGIAFIILGLIWIFLR